MELKYKSETGKWALSSPHDSGIIFSHGSFIKEKFRGKGLGNIEHEKRINIAREMGYSCIVATVISNNEIEKHILQKHGWQVVHRFFNPKVKYMIEIWIKDI